MVQSVLSKSPHIFFLANIFLTTIWHKICRFLFPCSHFSSRNARITVCPRSFVRALLSAKPHFDLSCPGSLLNFSHIAHYISMCRFDLGTLVPLYNVYLTWHEHLYCVIFANEFMLLSTCGLPHVVETKYYSTSMFCELSSRTF